MGFTPPMLLPVRIPVRRSLGAIVMILALFAAAQAWAETAAADPSSVETYTNQAVPPASPQDLMPEGVEWNKPLKGGTLTLPKPPKPKAPKSTQELQPPTLPVGGLKAPQMKGSAAPPLLSSGNASSANVMMMQGMKNALQQSGQNPNIPVTAPATEGENAAPAGTEGGVVAVPSAPALPEPKGLEKGPPGVAYQPGRAPRDLATNKPLDKAAAPAPATEENCAPTPAGPVAAAAAAGTEAPKATELEQPPVPLEQMPSQPSMATKAEPKAKAAASSIFGQPVAEPAEEKAETAAAAKPEETKPAPKACESKVTSWIRECSEAGYAANYTGKITGETRVECPSGDTHDVWISNTCALAPATAANEPRATEIRESPSSLAEGETKASSSSASEAMPVPSAVRLDANCGAANGSAADGKPAADLCALGASSEVTGEGPWRWSCKGSNGGMTVSCAAPVAKAAAKATEKAKGAASPAAASPEDGKCGAANDTGAETAPTQSLCAKGTPSRVNGGGPWTWACGGTNGGQAAACTAPKKVDGVCGVANETGTENMPERDLCTTGYASAVTGEGPWNWTCSGLYGGAASTCTASPKINAVCGPASLTGHTEAPSDGLCKVGESSSVEGGGPWNWTCSGTHGGAPVSCKAATMVEGLCGPANGGSFDKAPDEELCSQGHAGRVTGLGPWNWNCSGLEGGGTVSCTASLGNKEKAASAGPVACGAAAETAAFQTPSQNLCKGGNASAVSGNGPWSWSCSDDDGHNVACTTLMATEGNCGTAANVPSAEAPSNDLCASGAPGAVKSDKKKTNWSWECRGSMGAATVSCSSPMTKPSAQAATPSVEDARCGAASGRGTTSKPADDLCVTGKPSAVRGSGPWTWTCAAGKSRKAECLAPKVLDGACGEANGSIQKALPLTGLCAAGTPTEVDGTGPWLWSCVGMGGGQSISCSAAAQSQARVDGSCGAAANAIMTHAPDANLCDSGVPSTVYGEGPWTWTCSGLNGGIAGSCTSSKVLPKAPPPPGLPTNGNCGPSNGVAAVVQPSEGLCSSGTTTALSGNGPWNWNCLGVNGGMTVSCTAPLMPPAPIEGVCGNANGVTTLTTPRSGLCSAGISSAVNGKGPWTWSCSGTNGGGAVSCTAPLAGKGPSRPLPSTVSPSSSGDDSEAPAPSAAPVGLVTPRLPTGPLPPLEKGTLPKLKPSKPLDIPTESSARPPVSLQDLGEPPSAAPDLPAGTEPLMPPPVRDTLKPSSSLKAPAGDSEGKSVPGSRLVLDSDISTLSFSRGSDSIDKDAAKSLDKLAGVLSSHGNARITLNAYAGTAGEVSPREARRLSLSRALAVRDYLTSKGVSSGRIDVRALGANVPSGDMDRVDVKVH